MITTKTLIDKDVASMFTEAKNGDSLAQYNIGVFYYWGVQEHYPKDTQKAWEWFKRSADNGQPDAQCCVGKMLMYGEAEDGVDPSEAILWFKRAAEQDNTDALVHVANCHYFGEGLKHDPDLAHSYLERAINLGSQEAIEIQEQWAEC